MSNLLCVRTDDLGETYGQLLTDVMVLGDVVKPRDMEVREVRPLLLSLSNPDRCFTKRPGINRALTYMEICQILAGDFRKSLFDAVSPLASKLLTEGGAYGPRTHEQLARVIRELMKDPDSRRAVVYVGRPQDLEHIHSSSTTDQPCTMTWQFLNRGGKLDMIVNMRSWDLVWGLANDVPCFVSVQQGLAWALKLEVGSYTHLAGSAHIYSRHYDMPEKVGIATDRLEPLVPRGLEQWEDQPERWSALVQDAVHALNMAEAALAGDSEPKNIPAQWLKPFRLWEKRFSAGDDD